MVDSKDELAVSKRNTLLEYPVNEIEASEQVRIPTAIPFGGDLTFS